MMAGHVLKTLGVVAILAGDPRPMIALSDAPSCSFFVIYTGAGFTLAYWRGGFHLFAEGDVVFGYVDRPGIHEMEVIPQPSLGEVGGQIIVEIEETGADLERAQATFYRRCHM